jgi:hypothetical protein
MGHVAAPELTSARRRGPRPWDTWRCRSPPLQVRSGAEGRGSARAHLSNEARSGAVGHMVAPEPTPVERCGPKLQLTWQRVDARPVPCLDLELVCGDT